ncbi:MAG TPA: hypothetical protein VK157_00245, partial [Phycisphaerales bacterium]|nr:hypothetical protein [Phycisphaerales bacterium]
MTPRFSPRRCGFVALLASSLLTGCGSDRATKFPLETLKAPRAGEAERAAALAKLTESAKANAIAAQRVRNDLEQVVRSVDAPIESRQLAMQALLDQTGEAADAANQQLIAQLLPIERDERMTQTYAAAAQSRNWTSATPALIRSLAKQSQVPFADRSEMKALTALSQPRTLEAVLFEQFLSPSTNNATGPAATDFARRVRIDAWDVLAQLDPTGSKRRDLLAQPVDAKSPGASVIAILRKADTDLRVLAASGAEVSWLLSLKPDGADKSWWQQATAAVAQVPASERLALRHIEAIRLTHRQQPARLTRTREDLLSDLRTRIEPRRKVVRTWKSPIPPYNEQLRATENSLAWADLITILAIDDALASPALRDALLPQVRADRNDRSTEYGGVLMTRTIADAESIVPILYAPRAGQKRGDMTFIPTDDMIATSGTALAFYHFHAQDRTNIDIAGPAESDIATANDL